MTTHLPTPILHVLLTLSLLTNLSLTPITPPWTPDPDDVVMVSQTVWGEARGCSRVEQEAVVWCILNRVDDGRFPNTISGVITAVGQFSGYSPKFPSEDFKELSEDVLTRWHNGEHGIPTDLVFFRADGHGHNTFYSECFGGHVYTWENMMENDSEG